MKRNGFCSAGKKARIALAVMALCGMTFVGARDVLAADTASSSYINAKMSDGKTASNNTTDGGAEQVVLGINNTVANMKSTIVGSENKMFSKSAPSLDEIYNTVIGTSNICGDDNNSAILNTVVGAKNKAISTGAMAIGYQNVASGTQSIAMGYQSDATEGYSTAIGNQTKVGAGNATGVGVQNMVSGSYATSLGAINTASGSNSIAIGNYNEAVNKNALALGSGESKQKIVLLTKKLLR